MPDPNTQADDDTRDGNGRSETAVAIRQARPDDYERVVSFTENTWPDHGGDYIPEIYHEWISGDDEDQRTFVVEIDGRVAGICQGVLLSAHEAWAQGMRVDPDYRGRNVSTLLDEALFDWAAAGGATVCRNMVFSWNAAGMGGSRAAGYRPSIEFRFAHPEPDPDADPELGVRGDPAVAWSYWHGSDARDELGGLAFDENETWAMSELTVPTLRWAADETALFVVQDDGVRGLAYRVRDYEREASDDGEEKERERWAEYGVGAWADADAARSLFAAVSRDAASIGADRTRVLLPETPRHVSDAAVCRVETSAEPDFVFAADLTLVSDR